MLLFFYELSLWILALLATPKFIYEFIRYKKHHHSILNKWGFNLPSFKKNQYPVLWIHAVSLGETKAVVTLSKELKKLFPFSTLIISSTTETGHAEAKKSIEQADFHLYLPFDFNFLTKRLIKRFNPDLLLLSESDLWFNFLRHAKKNGAVIGLVNGKISQRSAERFSKVPFFSKALFNQFDFFCLQNNFYLERFMQLGISQDRLKVTGNLKFDDDYPILNQQEISEWKEKLKIQPDQQILTIGSTHDPEEALLINVLQEVWKTEPNLKVLLIPRHPERYIEAGKIVEKQGISWINYSDIQSSSGHEKVIILNVMGLLRIAYQLSTLSIVGGSFTSKVGGHNILEPCWYGKPVLFGPHMHTQVEFTELVKKYRCGKQLNSEELLAQLLNLLNNPAECAQLGNNGIQMMQDLRGSTTKTMIALEPVLQKIIKKNSK